jgi:hypothetical protein
MNEAASYGDLEGDHAIGSAKGLKFCAWRDFL